MRSSDGRRNHRCRRLAESSVCGHSFASIFTGFTIIQIDQVSTHRGDADAGAMIPILASFTINHKWSIIKPIADTVGVGIHRSDLGSERNSSEAGRGTSSLIAQADGGTRLSCHLLKESDTKLQQHAMRKESEKPGFSSWETRMQRGLGHLVTRFSFGRHILTSTSCDAGLLCAKTTKLSSHAESQNILCTGFQWKTYFRIGGWQTAFRCCTTQLTLIFHMVAK